MFGSLAFYKECRSQGISPIVGCEVYKAPGSRLEKTGNEKGTRHNHFILVPSETFLPVPMQMSTSCARAPSRSV
jgi:DNA polymerase III alpha subunit